MATSPTLCAALAALTLVLGASSAWAQADAAGASGVAGMPDTGAPFGVGGPDVESPAFGSSPDVSPQSRTTLVAVTALAGTDPRAAAAVARVFRREVSFLAMCHTRILRNDPTVLGTLRLEFQVGPAGRTTGCTVAQSPDVSVGTCACSRARNLAFPPVAAAAPRQFAVVLELQAQPARTVGPAPGCGGPERESMPRVVYALAERVATRRCLGPRGGVTYRHGTLEVYADRGPHAPQTYLVAGGGADAFRRAGVRRVRLHVTGGPTGEFDVLATQAIDVSP